MTIATLIEDKNVPGQFRVEAEVEDGAVEVAVFSGPNAKERAINFAGGSYYGAWADTENWSGICSGNEG